MLGVEYKLGKLSLKKEVQGDVRALLTNSAGSYFMTSYGADSKYDGFFVYDKEDQEMYKIIDSMGIGFQSLTNNFSSIFLENTEISMPDGKNAMVIKPGIPLIFKFDVKKSYDSRIWGRNYKITENKNEIIIEFIKKTDSREDDSHDQEEFRFYTVIRHNGTYTMFDEWINKIYPYDSHREQSVSERYVYKTLAIDAMRIVVVASKSLEQAQKDAKELFKKYKPKKLKPKLITNDKEINLAYNAAINSLDSLMVENRILAGLPWFFQFWTRDEAISVGALIKQKRIKEAKDIIMKELGLVQKNGRLANRTPGTDTDSADATGWALFRLSQIVKEKNLDEAETIFLKAKLEYILTKMIDTYTNNELIYNNPQETWMDTVVNGEDSRAGARIEIQALQLALYKFVYELSDQEHFLHLAMKLKEAIKTNFWNNEILADGIEDFTIRPNIFIAYYVYPELLTDDEWKTCFDNALKKLWLDWGGLSTIDKEHHLFRANHTGENNASYHRGDSWYWINNLAAICLYRLDKERYKDHIDKILEASTNEILWMGVAGSHAEISSASHQESRGCLAQAWSLAMYIELIIELFD